MNVGPLSGGCAAGTVLRSVAQSSSTFVLAASMFALLAAFSFVAP
jgi:hypothetical protein